MVVVRRPIGSLTAASFDGARNHWPLFHENKNKFQLEMQSACPNWKEWSDHVTWIEKLCKLEMLMSETSGDEGLSILEARTGEY